MSQSSKYRVTRSPDRVTITHVDRGPYTVINTSTETTVWLDDNSGLQVGGGVPLYPGTNMLWHAGELWAVSESDDVEIITSFDVSLWEPNPIALAASILNSGLLLVDQPVQVFFGSIGLAGIGPFDVSRYQTVSISMNCSVSTTVATPTVVALDFQAAGQQVLTRNFVFINSREVKMTFPILGNSMSIQTTLGPDVQVAQVVLSHRQNSLIQQFNEGTSLIDRRVTVADGADQNIDDMIPYFGDAAVYCTYNGAAPGNSRVLILYPDAFGILRGKDVFSNWASTGLFRTVRDHHVFAGASPRFTISNRTGASQDFNLLVVPVSAPAGSI